MMKRTFIFLLSLLWFVPLAAQREPSKSPLNPAFLNYIEAKKNGTLKTTTADGYKLGYIPSPLNPYFRDRTGTEKKVKSTAEFPVSYDLRDLGFVTVPKNQGGGSFGGNCVAFATCGTIESRWLVMGEGEYDLSEQNVAACYGYEWGYGEGANQAMATAYLSRLDGPILDSEDPYNTSSHSCLQGITPTAYVPEARWLPKDVNLVKQAIMDFGGLFVSAHIDYESFNYTFNTYYYDGDEDGNHAWMVVGWDDFKLTEGGIGAWIIRNSWGDDWAEDGYIYCSYNDTKILDDVAFFPVRWKKNHVDKIYMHDELGAIYSVGYDDPEAYGLAKFIAEKEELVTKVGTFVYAEGTILDFEIYDDFNEDSLWNLLSSKYDIYVDMPGYYTFDLPTTVNGDFYVKVRYYSPGYNFPIPVEAYVEDYSDPVIDTSVNWISATAKNWFSTNPVPEDQDPGENLTIRAYSVDITGPRALFESNKEYVCLGSNVTYTFLENETANEFHWDFGIDATPATATTQGPHNVSYSSEGRKTISLIVSGPGGNDTLVRHDYISVVSEIEVIIAEDTIEGPRGLEYKLTAFGADTYTWSPADHLSSTTGKSVIASPPNEGEYLYSVTGQQGSCEASDQVRLILKIPPPNDNVCDAIQLLEGGWQGAFNNINATVEANEPFPPEGDCSTEGFWCVEGGLQCSVWFWFIGSPRGIAQINSHGLDNQIAIYEAETCEDILTDNWTRIYAFDDTEGRADYSFHIDTEVTPGQTYFVQIDGSAGGDEGWFDLIYWDYAIGTEEWEMNNNLELYPNPSEGLINLKMNLDNNLPVVVQLFNLNGQLMLSETFENSGGQFETVLDLSKQVPGMYQVRVIQGEMVVHRKLILD